MNDVIDILSRFVFAVLDVLRDMVTFAFTWLQPVASVVGMPVELVGALLLGVILILMWTALGAFAERPK